MIWTTKRSGRGLNFGTAIVAWLTSLRTFAPPCAKLKLCPLIFGFNASSLR